jgi:hypothetical protein
MEIRFKHGIDLRHRPLRLINVKSTRCSRLAFYPFPLLGGTGRAIVERDLEPAGVVTV